MTRHIDKRVLTDGLDRAVALVEEDEVTAILVVAVHRGGRGVRIWSSGDMDDQDVIKDRLMRSLPLSRKTAVVEKPEEPEEYDPA